MDQIATAVATEHSSTSHFSTEDKDGENDEDDDMLLRQQDIVTLRHAHLGRSLHKVARDALNAITDIGCPSPKPLDTWFPWREHVACHPRANEIIASGVTRATAEAIEHTMDANRGGSPRIDFIMYRADGTHCHIHPGTKKGNDAKLIFPRETGGQGPATERTPAQYQWSSLPEIPLTRAAAATIPQTDRIGKARAYQSLADIAPGPLLTTADALSKWWLFLPNLGHNTADVIGDGLIAAELTQKLNNAVELMFTRCDHTIVRAQITQPDRSRCHTRMLA
jgi:hypothetical protein